MKKPISYIIFLIIFFSSLFSFAQETISLDLKDQSILTVLNEIGKQTKYNFVFAHSIINDDLKITVKAENEDIINLLHRIFRGTGIAITVIEDQIILHAANNDKEKKSSFRKKNLTTVNKSKEDSVAIHSKNQSDSVKKIIRGEISDILRIPLEGVQITADSLKFVRYSDHNGKFEIVVPEKTTHLSFSLDGYETQRIDISTNDYFHVLLLDNSENLNEVVITGYQSISKERATGSFVKVDKKTLEMRPVNNVIDKLEGFAAGVNYTNGKIEIRGVSSLFANKYPLYVVDGFPIEGRLISDNPLGSLNPEDVESVTILKDASAASIWGVRASNGVIVITTKKGKRNQKLQINFSNYTAVTQKIDYSKMNWMSTSDQIDLELEYTDKNWNNYPGILNRKKGISLLDEAYIYVNGLSPDGDIWSRNQYDKYIAELKTKSATEQWEKYLLQNPLEITYNLSILGGSENNSFRVSMVYNDNEEAAIGNSNNRTIFNIHDTYRFNDRIHFIANINFSMRNKDLNGISYTEAKNEKAYNELIDQFGQTIQYYKKWNRWVSQEREAINGIGSYSYNVLDEHRNTDKSSEELDVRARFGIKFKIGKDLNFDTNFQYQKGYYSFDEFNSMNFPDHRIKVWDMYTDPDWNDDKDELVYQIPLGTEYKFQRSEYYAWDFRNTLTWDKAWKKNIITLFGGTEIKKRYYEEFRDKKYGYNKQTTTHVPVNQADLIGGKLRDWNGVRFYDTFYSTLNTDDREVSVFSNIGYEFDKRFSVNGSFRIDQKNLFGNDPAFRYKPLWSAGIGWNINNEHFMDNVNFVERLRFRATYGLTGNASNRYSPYMQARNYLKSWGNNIYDYLELIQPANDKLKWEETTTLNIALDFDLFKNRLNGTIEYYHKNSQDLIGLKRLDVTNGFSKAWVNYASMINEGYEITLNGLIFYSKDFKWNSGLNLSYNNNKITKLEDQLQIPRNIVLFGKEEVGSSYNNLYSYNYAGLDSGGNILLYNTDGTTKSWREDVNDESELIYQGLKVAPYYGGFNNTFFYKAFDLSINTTFKFGHKFLNLSYGRSASGWTKRSHKIFLSRWKKPGDELTTRIPKIAYDGLNPYSGEYESRWDSSDADHFWQFSQDNIHNAGFIRVRDIILGYTMPKKYLNKVFIQNFRITAQVTNPFLWVANDLGLDPEAHERMAYNNLKTFTFGIRLSF